MKLDVKISIFIISISVILLYMSEFTWGDLPKNQIDPQLITEAITEAINAHESDPEAHLGAGESLEMHRQNEILDHPASSIVADKISDTSSFIFVPVLPYDPLHLSSASALNSTPFLTIYQSSPIVGGGQYLIGEMFPYELGYTGGEIVFDFVLGAGGNTGSWIASFEFSFATIEFREGEYRIGYYNGSWNYTAWTALTFDNGKRIRFHYSVVDSALIVTIVGNTVFSVVTTPIFAEDTLQFLLRVNRGTSTTAQIFIGNLNFYLEGI